MPTAFEWLTPFLGLGLAGLKSNSLTGSQSCGQLGRSSVEQVFCTTIRLLAFSSFRPLPSYRLTPFESFYVSMTTPFDGLTSV